MYTVNIYRYKAIGANATSSVILYTGKCISPCLEILQLLQVILQGLKDYLQELQDFQTGANAFTGIQNYTGCCISPYSFVPINIYSVGPFITMYLRYVLTCPCLETGLGHDLHKKCFILRAICQLKMCTYLFCIYQHYQSQDHLFSFYRTRVRQYDEIQNFCTFFNQ